MAATLKEMFLASSYQSEIDTKDTYIAKLETAMRKAADIIDTNLYHQAEKVQDASAILRQAIKQ